MASPTAQFLEDTLGKCLGINFCRGWIGKFCSLNSDLLQGIATKLDGIQRAGGFTPDSFTRAASSCLQAAVADARDDLDVLHRDIFCMHLLWLRLLSLANQNTPWVEEFLLCLAETSYGRGRTLQKTQFLRAVVPMAARLTDHQEQLARQQEQLSSLQAALSSKLGALGNTPVKFKLAYKFFFFPVLRPVT